jgi:ribonuclease J
MLRVIPLGGVSEIGKNMTLVEQDGEILVIDCGLMFPEEEMLGVDIVINDFRYLIERRDQVRGIVLTHGHEDHIGGLPYLLRDIDAPLWGTRLTLGLVSAKLEEWGLADHAPLRRESA